MSENSNTTNRPTDGIGQVSGRGDTGRATPMSTPTNLQRAVWAETALAAFTVATGCDHEDSLGDLLSDLMHWAKLAGFDFDAALDRARFHFEVEAAS